MRMNGLGISIPVKRYKYYDNYDDYKSFADGIGKN